MGTTRNSLVIRSHSHTLAHMPPPGHPESPARIQAVLAALKEVDSAPWILEEEAALASRNDALGVLKWIHSEDYIERFQKASAGGEWDGGSDCPVSPGSFEAALAAAQMTLQAALDLANERVRRLFLLTRPPAHHAERNRARGYCYFNHVALAAEVVVRAWNKPVLVVDFDAHHGQGTQEHFFDRKDVGFVSVHTFPAFPGSGAANEVGLREGIGTTRNLPLTADASDEVVGAALRSIVFEVGAALQPAAIVVSAGFNGHADDPVGQMSMTSDGYRDLARIIVEAAETWSHGRILSVLEGGFHPEALPESVVAFLDEVAKG